MLICRTQTLETFLYYYYILGQSSPSLFPLYIFLLVFCLRDRKNFKNLHNTLSNNKELNRHFIPPPELVIFLLHKSTCVRVSQIKRFFQACLQLSTPCIHHVCNASEWYIISSTDLATVQNQILNMFIIPFYNLKTG